MWRPGFDKEWKPGPDPVSLPADDIARIRPMVIEELNRRTPGENRGNQLEELLDNGNEQSSRLCVQNAVILLAWLSSPMALLAIVAMFIAPKTTVDGPQENTIMN